MRDILNSEIILYRGGSDSTAEASVRTEKFLGIKCYRTKFSNPNHVSGKTMWYSTDKYEHYVLCEAQFRQGAKGCRRRQQLGVVESRQNRRIGI